jgi:hypothetical protein
MMPLAVDARVVVPLLVRTHRAQEPLLLGPDMAGRISEVLSRLGIAGGAVYDGLVALAAREHGAELATRDVLAKATYETVGARVMVPG